MAKGLFLHDSIIDTILFASKGDRAKMGEVFEALVDYARTGGVRPDISDLTKMVLINAVPLIDISNARALAGAKGGARSHGGGAPKGNRNASKQQANNKQNNKQTKQLKTTKQQAKQQANTNVPPCNFMENRELQAKQQANNKQTTSDIDIDIDIDRLNTSPLTELVLSQEKINKKEKSETAPATLEGGAAPSFSETRNDFSRDYNARVSAMIWRGVSAMPQTSQPTSPSLQSPPPPTPAPVCGGKYEIREGDDETMRNIKTQCKAEVARAEDERGAEAKGGPLPKSAGRIRSNDILHDDSKEHEIEIDRRRMESYEIMAKDEREDEETRAMFKDMANEIKTKIANYESTKN